MRAKSEAQAMLEQIEKLDTMIRNKLIEKKQWMDVALGVTASMDANRVQTSGARSKMAEAVNKCVDIEAEVDEAVDKFIAAKREAVRIIESLESPIEYNVLHMRYIQYIGLQAIADHYGKEYSWVTTTHGRAISNVQKILYRKSL